MTLSDYSFAKPSAFRKERCGVLTKKYVQYLGRHCMLNNFTYTLPWVQCKGKNYCFDKYSWWHLSIIEIFYNDSIIDQSHLTQISETFMKFCITKENLKQIHIYKSFWAIIFTLEIYRKFVLNNWKAKTIQPDFHLYDGWWRNWRDLRSVCF